MILAYNQLDIPELTQKRNDQKKQFLELQNTFLDLENTLRKNREEQQQLEKKYALILKQIQTIKNENFTVTRKKSTLSNAAQLLIDDIEKKENELNRLSIGKDELEDKNEQFRKQIQELSSLNDIQKKVCDESNESIEMLTNEKKELSANISSRLSNISTEKDTIEKELNDLNLQFMNSISNREEALNAKQSIESSYHQLVETKEKDQKNLQQLEQALKNSKEMKDLERQYAALKQENDEQLSGWKSLKQSTQDKEKALNELISKLETTKQQSQRLENEVKEFDTVVTQYEREHQSLKKEQERYQQYVDNLASLPSDMEEAITFLLAASDHDSLFKETFATVHS